MKYISNIFPAFLLAAAFSVAGCTQSKPTGFTVKGTTDSKADSMSIYIGLDDLVASAPVVNGKFELKGSVTEPQNAEFAAIQNGEKRSAGRLILENADYTYSRVGKHVKIKGGKLHDRVLGFESGDEYIAAVDDYETTLEKLYADGSKKDYDDLTQEEKDLVSEKFKAGLAVEDRELNKVINDPEAPVLAKVFALGRIQDSKTYPFEKRIEMFDAYEKELGTPSLELTKLRDVFKNFIEQEKKSETVSVGKMFKDANAKDANGNVVKLSDVVAKNKFTILEFWASWCGPCRGEIPKLKKAYEKYKSKGLEIYSISVDKKTADWKKALAEEKPSWIQVIDAENVADEYGIQGIPASFLIGQDGKIVEVSEKLRGAELDKTLSKYLP